MLKACSSMKLYSFKSLMSTAQSMPLSYMNYWRRVFQMVSNFTSSFVLPTCMSMCMRELSNTILFHMYCGWHLSISKFISEHWEQYTVPENLEGLWKPGRYKDQLQKQKSRTIITIVFLSRLHQELCQSGHLQTSDPGLRCILFDACIGVTCL